MPVNKLLNTLEALCQKESLSEEFKSVLHLLGISINSTEINLDTVTSNMVEGFAHCKIICNKDGLPVDYKFLAINKAFTEQTGLKKKNVIGKTVLEIYPDLEKSWIALYGRVALYQEPAIFTEFNHNTNKYYTTSAYSNAPGEFIMLFNDVTEIEALKKAELAAAKAKKTHSDLLFNMNEAYSYCQVIYNEKGVAHDFRVLQVNEAYSLHTGINSDAIVGKTMLEYFPDVEQSWMDIFINVALTQESHSFIDYNHNTGKYYDMNAYSPKKGEFALIFKDITIQENKRELLEKAYEKAAESDRLKSAFLANMSHEIRTPMNAILGCSALLEDKELAEEEKVKCLAHINTSGNRLLTLISDIVDISKIDAQQQLLKYQEHNLNKLLTGIKEQFEVTNSTSNITLHLEYGLLDEKSVINTDDCKLAQILSNLLENAFKFTRVGQITFGYSLKEGLLHFYVKDSGIGIKPEEQATVFKRFGQVIDSETKMNSGSGLGLSIAKGLVALFGGKMKLDSVFEEGSTFHFTIPYLPVKK